MFILHSLIFRTCSNTFTCPVFRPFSSRASTARNVPVRPTPALRGQNDVIIVDVIIAKDTECNTECVIISTEDLQTRELSGRLPTVNKYFTDHSTLLFPNVRLEGKKTQVFGGAVVRPLPEVELNHRPFLFCLQGKILVLTIHYSLILTTTVLLFYFKVYILKILTLSGRLETERLK